MSETVTDEFDAAFAESLGEPLPEVDESFEEPVEAPVEEPSDESDESVEVAEAEATETEDVEEPVEDVVDELVEDDEPEEPEPAPEQNTLTLDQVKDMLDAQRRELEEKFKQPEPVQDKDVEDTSEADELDAKVAKFREDWPETVEGVSAMIAQQMAEFKQTLAQELATIRNEFAPTVQSVQQSAQQTEMDMILTAHPDARDIAADLDTWIGSQVPMLRTAYANALSEGSAEDVIEVLNIYKQATGAAKPTRQKPQPKQPSPAKAQKLAQMTEPKASAATTVSDEPDTYDYDSAWDAAIN